MFYIPIGPYAVQHKIDMKTQQELIHELAQLQHEAESITRLMHDLSDHLARILDTKSLIRKELDSSYEQAKKD